MNDRKKKKVKWVKTKKCPDFWDIEGLNEDYNAGRLTAVRLLEETPEWFQRKKVMTKKMNDRKNNFHELKTLPEFFWAVVDEAKTFEVRKNDRDFKVGDEVRLLEFSPDTGYSGEWLHRKITYILPGGQFGIEKDFVVMGLSNL